MMQPAALKTERPTSNKSQVNLSPSSNNPLQFAADLHQSNSSNPFKIADDHDNPLQLFSNTKDKSNPFQPLANPVDGSANNNLTKTIFGQPNNINNTGLPHQLKSGVEKISGYSLDDVKVHYNSEKPKQLQAHAYAQGTEIHVAPGQEKHLAHETWHVVQQKQGRVQSTLQLKDGVNINDDSVLEKEADVMGARALNVQAEQIPLISATGSLSGPVQRAIAIEAESTGNWKISGKKSAADDKFASIKDTKSALGSKGQVDLTSDNGNLEFVTRTLSTEGEVEAAFTTMSGTLNALAAASPAVIDTLPADFAGLDWITQSGYAQYRLAATSKAQGTTENVLFLPQATIDIPFSSFNAYIKKFQNKENALLMGESFVETAKYVDKNNPAFFMSLDDYGLAGSAGMGFLKMVMMALYDAWGFAGREDPKYAFATMPRNRFSEMFTAANAASGGHLTDVFPRFAAEVVKMRTDLRIPNLFTNRYKGDSGQVQGPTVEAWLNSIMAPEFMLGNHREGGSDERRSDLLSPPPGQRDKREGLGAYNLAGGIVPFFELRDFMSSQSKRTPVKLEAIFSAAKALLAVEETLREAPVPVP